MQLATSSFSLAIRRVGVCLIMAIVMMALNPTKMWADDITITVLEGTQTFVHSPEELFDGEVTTKWCTGDFRTNGAYIIFKINEAAAVTGYTIVDGKDTNSYSFYGRHWDSWTLYGASFSSDDDANLNSENWEVVDSRSGQKYKTDENASVASHNYTVKNASEYQYYKLVITGIGKSYHEYDDELDDCQQMAEMSFTWCNHIFVNYHCTLCGAYKEHTHVFPETSEVDATCTEGSKSHCTLCNELLSDGKTAAFSHTVPAEFTNGVKECSVCHGFVYQSLGEAVDGWYSISNAGQLCYFSQMVTANPTVEYKAKLTADINMSGITSYAPVCYATSKENLSLETSKISQPGFKGTFDGQGHTITGLTIETNEDHFSTGLFGNNSGTICNLGLVSYKYDNKDKFDGRFAAIAGVNFGTIRNCYVMSSTVSSASKICGAITAANYGGKVENCYELNNTINANGRCGHMVGDANNDGAILNGIIINCYSDNKLGNENNSKYPGGGQTGETNVTAARFASGEIAYKLNGGASGKTDGSQLWYQKLPVSGSEKSDSDAAPVLKKASDGSNTVYRSIGEKCNDISYNNTASTLGAQKHDYAVSQWTWANDGSTAKATFTCKNDASHKMDPIDATVTSAQKTAATCSVKGTTTYTATVTFDGKIFTDTKDVQDIATISHTASADFNENGIKDCTVCHAFVSAQSLDKDGEGWYTIKNAGQLISFSQMVTANPSAEYKAKLTADINMSGITAYAPVCYATSTDNLSRTTSSITQPGFQGTFDGQGYTITGLTITPDQNQYSTGLFGNNSGTICNLGIVNFSYDNQNKFDGRFAAIAGVNFGTIRNCYVTSSKVSSSEHICGAITGANYGGKIENCYEAGNTISTHSRCGHMVGDANNDGASLKGIIINCYSDNKLGNENQSGYLGQGQTGETNVTAARFASGEITYKLNGGEYGKTDGTQAWFQVIPDEEKSGDSYPVLKANGANTVYCTYGETCTDVTYNNNGGLGTPDHEFDYDKPVWTWNENGNAARVTFTCQRDNTHRKVIEATITSAVKTAATCSVKGTTTYTASVKVGEKEYTDSRDVQDIIVDHTVPAEYTNGIKECSVCHNPVYQPLGEAVDGWYSIGNAGQLISFANKVNDGDQTIKGKLTADIDMQGVELVQIGASSKKPFQGELDGQDFAIRNLVINASDDYAASLIGYADKVTIQRLTVQGTITTSKKFAAGFIGRNDNNTSKIIKCISAVDIVSTVIGDGTHAGFVGVAGAAVAINNCAFVGSITSETGTTHCAGLIGWDTNKGSQATHCYVTATFTSGICEMQLIRNRDANAFATCYFLNACGTSQGSEITAQMVANGELCYKLNGGESGKTDGTQAWYQKLPDSESVEADSYPVLKNTGSNTVYFGYADCQATEKTYANVEMSKTQGHVFAGGATSGECTICHKHFNEKGEEVAPTGIKKISSNPLNDSAEEIYDIMGRRQQGVVKGLNIIKQSDGTVKRVVVK